MEEASVSESRPRKPWLAFLLSLAEPGLGQLYNGMLAKAIVVALVPLLAYPVLYGVLVAGYIRMALSTAVFLAIAYYIAVATDALLWGRRQSSQYLPKACNQWYYYLLFVGLNILVGSSLAAHFKKNYIQAFKIPAASMQPTYIAGDFVLVDRRISARHPARGDVVVFQFPRDPNVEFIKRVVAIGGDRIEIRERVLLINDVPVEEPYAIQTEEGKVLPSRDPRINFGPTSVPAESYFVLGDNRDNSFDSRYWGPVSASAVEGTALGIYWSWDKEQRSVRWTRIGLSPGP